MGIQQLGRTCRIVPGEDGPSGHYFGGPPIHEGARFPKAKQALHMLYCFNLSDPALSGIKRTEGTTRLRVSNQCD